MASQFQNRLVGITILVASVVIFLPSIIDGKKTAYEDEFVATPIHPEVEKHTQQLPAPTSAPIEQETDESYAIEDEDTELAEGEQWRIEEEIKTLTIETKEPKKTVVEVNKSPLPIKIKSPVKKKVPESAWTIQLGAFQNAANINSLLKTLHKAGFQAHTVPADVIDGELTRLFVGPDVSKSKLEKQLPRLKRLTKLQGKLLPFDATNP